MSDQPADPEGAHDEWSNCVAEKETRKLRARSRRDRSIWFGLGAFGVVGWSVAVPTLIGLFVGIWIDKTWQGGHSWTLMLFLAGLALGCYSAWRWLYFESGLLEHEDPGREDQPSDE